MPYNSKILINNLNFKSKTHILLKFYSTNVTFRIPNIFKITKNATQNSIKLKFRIIIHQNNSLN